MLMNMRDWSSLCYHKANCTDTEGSYKCTCIMVILKMAKISNPVNLFVNVFYSKTVLIVFCSGIIH